MFADKIEGSGGCLDRDCTCILNNTIILRLVGGFLKKACILLILVLSKTLLNLAPLDQTEPLDCIVADRGTRHATLVT